MQCCIESYSPLQEIRLNDTFVFLHSVMECVIADHGNNSYKRPHIGKRKLRRAGLLGRNYVCDEDVYHVGAAYHLLVTREREDKEALLRLQIEAVRIIMSDE